MFKEVKENMNHDKYLSKYACKNNEGERLNKEESDIRPCFYRDCDRVIYSLSYSRYMDKTQVFSRVNNDHISKRITHVQMVSKIARTIARALNLNEDLIEAASLAHDIGHAPLGHVGEKILNKISLENDLGYFNHNIQSVRNLMYVENKGKGYNLTIQVLDAIMCHNGEFLENKLTRIKKTKEEFLNEYNLTYTKKEICNNLKPMTLEGCVLRISDVIGYIARDVEDAIRLNIITINDIPQSIIKTLGKNNREIVNTLVLDIIKNSYNKSYIKLSNNIFNELKKLMNFNYKYIYDKANTKEMILEYENMFRTLFNKYVEDLDNNNKDSFIYKHFINDMDKSYIKNNSNKRIVLDYISGMTDDYFYKQYELIKNIK